MSNDIKPSSSIQPSSIQLEEFKGAVGERYEGIDSELASSTILGKLTSLLRDGFDLAGVKHINSRKAKIIIIEVSDEEEGG
jgi:hypothetical protein